MFNVELLNQVKNLLINHANQTGLELSTEFASVADFKNFVIAFTIRSCVETVGMTTKAAYDLVMGDGSFDQLAEDCFNELQGRA